MSASSGIGGKFSVYQDSISCIDRAGDEKRCKCWKFDEISLNGGILPFSMSILYI